MSFQRVRELLEQTAHYCEQEGIKCPPEHLRECVVEYDSLLTTTGDHAPAVAVFEALLAIAIHQPKPCEWLLGELRFEACVAIVGERNQLALLDLQLHPVSDQSLDLYNERISRSFAHR